MDEQKAAEQATKGKAATFPVEIDYTSLEGIPYKGILYFRLPSVKETMRMGGLIAEYLQGQYPSGKIDPNLIPPTISDLAEAVATIQLLLVKGPEWAVKIEDCADFDLPLWIIRQYRAARRQFRHAGEKPAEGGV